MKLFDVKLGKCIVGFYYKTLWTDNTLKQSSYRQIGVYTSRHLSYVWYNDEKTGEKKRESTYNFGLDLFVARLWISFNFNKKKVNKPKEDKRKFVEPLTAEEVVWEQ
jgi:hypothetical protein